MNQCKNCGERSYSKIVIYTETTFGHGDSSHCCYVTCTTCGTTTKDKAVWAHGLCSDEAIRTAQAFWNNLNPQPKT